jgi:hypothetical protein
MRESHGKKHLEAVCDMRLNVEAWRSIIVGIPDRSRELRHNAEAMCARPDDKSSVVVDRELEEEKSHDPSGPRIRCPLCGWSPRKEDKWFCTCGNERNTFETGGVCGMSPMLDFDTMPLMRTMVAAFGIGMLDERTPACSARCHTSEFHF